VYVLLKLAVAFGAVWAMGFFTYHFIRLLLGRRTFWAPQRKRGVSRRYCRDENLSRGGSGFQWK